MKSSRKRGCKVHKQKMRSPTEEYQCAIFRSSLWLATRPWSRCFPQELCSRFVPNTSDIARTATDPSTPQQEQNDRLKNKGYFVCTLAGSSDPQNRISPSKVRSPAREFAGSHPSEQQLETNQLTLEYHGRRTLSADTPLLVLTARRQCCSASSFMQFEWKMKRRYHASLGPLDPLLDSTKKAHVCTSARWNCVCPRFKLPFKAWTYGETTPRIRIYVHV